MFANDRQNGVTRRDFLKTGSLAAGAATLSLADALRAGEARGERNCIVLFLVGGPSHLDTFDLKPNAPSEVRGPFRPIKTNVPGVEVCEHLPLMAKMAHRYAIVRSVHHTAAPIHETGHQLMQTGRLSTGGVEHPNYGAVVSYLKGERNQYPAFALLSKPIGNTGVSVGHGQGAGFLGPEHEPLVLPAGCWDMSFEDRARLAGLTIRLGGRCFTVNMFDSVFDKVTWDCHADGGSLASTLDDYKDTLCPTFDRGYTRLLDYLSERGLLDTTLVVAMGEFGRTPYLNPRGGRDHWPGVWSVLFAGGGVKGGQVVGSSDRIGSEPRDRPVTPAMIAATIYHAMGIDPKTRIPGPDGRPIPIADAEPIHELFA